LKGYWSLPGGLVETGEHLEEAIVREVREETGLRVKPQFVLEIFERIMRDGSGRAEYHYVLVDYVCKLEGRGTALAGDDVSAVAWVKRCALADFKLTEGTCEVIEKGFDARRRRT
jgi:ADP-ribose pyrophosphatase YjhB (NUDIX family)